MNKYYLFAGYDYYPCGGAYDYQGTFDTPEDALLCLKNNKLYYDWAHLASIQDNKLKVVCYLKENEISFHLNWNDNNLKFYPASKDNE